MPKQNQVSRGNSQVNRGNQQQLNRGNKAGRQQDATEENTRRR